MEGGGTYGEKLNDGSGRSGFMRLLIVHRDGI